MFCFITRDWIKSTFPAEAKNCPSGENSKWKTGVAVLQIQMEWSLMWDVQDLQTGEKESVSRARGHRTHSKMGGVPLSVVNKSSQVNQELHCKSGLK